jgi:hypothetical protein
MFIVFTEKTDSKSLRARDLEIFMADVEARQFVRQYDSVGQLLLAVSLEDRR